MKGKSTFTQAEADQIIKLIRLKLQSDSNQQKGIRNKIRKLDFYASDFGLAGGYTERDFLNAVTVIQKHSSIAQEAVGIINRDNQKVPEVMERTDSANLIASFPPIVPSEPKVLILGTMPGKRSLVLQQYYGHGGNSFWKIMTYILNELYAESYARRTEMLKERGIALWDVLKACIRESSADSDIQSEEANDFHSFFNTHTTIQMIFFNGQKAAEFFGKYVGSVKIEQHTLPSTSPANTWATYEQKLQEWKKILLYV